MKNILVTEDDKDVRDTIRILLESEGYTVEEACNGEEALEKLSHHVDLIILDVMMPGRNGYQICKDIREKYFIPIIFLTARDSEDDKILAFRSGGDDFLVKPFSYAELSARIAALLRRSDLYNSKFSGNSSDDHWLTRNNIKINKEYNKVFINNSEIQLTETEYSILLLLMNNPDKVLSLKEIYMAIWPDDQVLGYSNSLVVHIKNLRKKLEPQNTSNKYIITVWGKGYRFVEI